MIVLISLVFLYYKTSLSKFDYDVVTTLYNVCSEHWGMFSALVVVQYIEGYQEYIEGYHEYIRGISWVHQWGGGGGVQ